MFSYRCSLLQCLKESIRFRFIESGSVFLHDSSQKSISAHFFQAFKHLWSIHQWDYIWHWNFSTIVPPFSAGISKYDKFVTVVVIIIIITNKGILYFKRKMNQILSKMNALCWSILDVETQMYTIFLVIKCLQKSSSEKIEAVSFTKDFCYAHGAAITMTLYKYLSFWLSIQLLDALTTILIYQ